MNLTTTVHLAYSVPNAAKSAFGTGTPEQNRKRTGATPSLDVPFFTFIERSSMGLCGSEMLSGIDGRFLRTGSSNSRTVPPFSAGTRRGGVQNPKRKEAVMPNHIFQVRDDISRSDLDDHVRYMAYKAKSLNESISELLSQKSGLQDQSVFDQLAWLNWLLSDVLEAQTLCCERLEVLVLADDAADSKQFMLDAAEKQSRQYQATIKSLRNKLRKKQRRVEAGQAHLDYIFSAIGDDVTGIQQVTRWIEGAQELEGRVSILENEKAEALEEAKLLKAKATETAIEHIESRNTANSEWQEQQVLLSRWVKRASDAEQDARLKNAQITKLENEIKLLKAEVVGGAL